LFALAVVAMWSSVVVAGEDSVTAIRAADLTRVEPLIDVLSLVMQNPP
jgi:hypothetical protein